MSPSRETPRQRLCGLRGRALHGFAAATGGAAAVEFAIISPVLVLMFFGVTELTNAYDARTKVTQAASTAADLTAQEKTVCNAEMDAIYEALGPIMRPFATTEPSPTPANPNLESPLITVVISSLVDAGHGTAKVAWSDSNVDGEALVVGSTEQLPDGLMTEDGSVILAEVEYTYKSTMGFFFPDPELMTDKFYLHPRKVEQIAWQSSC